MQPRLLNLREVAHILHLSRSSVYMLVRRGDIVTLKFGKVLRVHPDDLETYVHAKRLHDEPNAQDFLYRQRQRP